MDMNLQTVNFAMLAKVGTLTAPQVNYRDFSTSKDPCPSVCPPKHINC